MQVRSSNKKGTILWIGICLMISLISGCNLWEEKGILRHQWYNLMAQKLQLTGMQPPLQLLQQWGVSVPSDLNQRITWDEVGSSLAEAVGNWPKANSQELYQTSLQCNLLTADDVNKKVVNKEHAERILDTLYQYLNTQDVNQSFTIQQAEQYLNQVPIDVDLQNNSATFSKELALLEGMWFSYQEEVYRIDKVERRQDDNQATLEKLNLEDLLENSELSTSFDVDFSQAEIISVPSEEYIFPVHFEPLTYVEQVKFRGNALLKQELEIKGFRVSWNCTSSGIHIHVSKKLENELSFQMDYDLTSIHPILTWKQKEGKLEEARFQLNYTMNESASLGRGIYQNLTSDLSNLKQNDLLNSLIHSFSNKKVPLEAVIPIAQIRLPVPQFPLVSILLQVQLHCYASGKMELSLSQDQSCGFQLRNGVFRPIFESQNHHDFILQCSAALTAGIAAAAQVAGLSIMDMSVQGGIRGVLRTTAFLPQLDGQVKKVENLEVPLDALESAYKAEDRVQLCGDLNLHLLLDLDVNSSKSLAGRFGVGKTFNLLTEKNASLNPNGKTHIEHGVFVDKCTRGKNVAATKLPEVIIRTDKIELSTMQLILDQNERVQLVVTGLPELVNLEDLEFTTSSASIVSVTQKGKITGNRSGNAVITVQDATKTYQAQCHVVVREKR